MLMHTREGTTIVTQQEKLKTKPDNRWTIYFKGSALFDPFCCLESIITYLRRAVFIFAPGKPSSAKPTFTRYHDTFSKSSTLPWKNWQQTASWSFCWSLVSSYNRLSKQSFVRLYGAGPLATSSLAWLLRGQKSLPSSLRNSLNSILRWFQWFSGALSSFSHFSGFTSV